MIYIAILLMLANIAVSFYFYKDLQKKLEERVERPKPAQIEEKRPEIETDNTETNDERRYLEGINAVLSYDIKTMKDYIKGVSEE